MAARLATRSGPHMRGHLLDGETEEETPALVLPEPCFGGAPLTTCSSVYTDLSSDGVRAAPHGVR